MLFDVYSGLKKKPFKDTVTHYAPTNIALCKYWGKRDTALNLPTHSSLSITLPPLGTTTTLTALPKGQWHVFFNEEELLSTDPFNFRLKKYMDSFHFECGLRVETTNDMPTKAGLASSASGFAALVLALNDMFDFQADPQTLSILARLGSGSACRSLSNGFVEWQEGLNDDSGKSSYGVSLPYVMPTLCVGIIMITEEEKKVASGHGMILSKQTSPFFDAWVHKARGDIVSMKDALRCGDFKTMGMLAQHNAMAMHAVMQTSKPSLCYALPETTRVIQKVLELQETEKQNIYFTQDAGPNIKLLFEKKDLTMIRSLFPDVLIIEPFGEH